MTDDNRATWKRADDALEQRIMAKVRRVIEGTRVKDSAITTTTLRLVPPPEPTDCPDSGPAKEAATADSDSGLPTPAPQRGTATGALSAEEEARRIAFSYVRLASGDVLEKCAAEIRALVRREVEAAKAEELSDTLHVFSEYRQLGGKVGEVLEYLDARRQLLESK